MVQLDKLQYEVGKLMSGRSEEEVKGLVNLLRMKSDLLPELLDEKDNKETLERHLSSMFFSILYLALEKKINLPKGVVYLVNRSDYDKSLEYLYGGNGNGKH